MKKKMNEFPYKSIFSPLTQSKVRLFIICTMQIIVSILIPFLLSNLIDTLSDRNNNYQFLVKCIVLAAVVVLNFIIDWWQNYSWHNFGWKAIVLMQKSCFRKLLSKPVEYFKDKDMGDTLNKFLNDSATFAQNEALNTLMVYLNILNIVGVLIFMFILNYRLSLSIFLFLIAYILFYNKLNKYLRETGLEEREAYSLVMNDAEEKFQGIETIYHYKCQDFFADKFRKTLDGYYQRIKRLNLFTAIGVSANSSFNNLMSLGAIVIGCILIMNNQMRIGALVAFYAYIAYFSEPVKNLADFNLQRQKALSVKERVMQILYDGNVDSANGKTEIENVTRIEFANVSFQYSNSPLILDHFTTEIVAGDKVAITGPSGVGKSTIFKLLLNQIRPTKGEIRFNGIPLSSIAFIEDRIAYLGQSPFLFEGTVMENIAFGKHISQSEINEALSISAVDIFCSSTKISSTIVKPNGTNYSGGEKQRIALARALVKNSDVILLDEVTSALDVQIEKEVVSNIDKYMQRNPSKIMIAITHRPEICKICNKKIEISPQSSQDK